MKIRIKFVVFILVLVSIVFMVFTGTRYLWFKARYRPEFIKLNRLDADCSLEKTCNNLVGVDCNAKVDGPYYYVEKDTGKIVSYCGGYCMGGVCTNCPPKEWTCK